MCKLRNLHLFLIRSLIQISKKIPEQILCTRRLSLGIFWEIISKNFNKILYIWFSTIVFRRFEFPFYRQFPHICQNPLFIFFPNPAFGKIFSTNWPNEIPNKHKNKLMWQSDFFIYRRLQNSTTKLLINNTFIRNTKLRFNPK